MADRDTGCTFTRATGFVRKKLMAILTVVAIILGFAIGFTVRLADPSADTILWLGFPGEMFLNLLRMPIIPLVASSVITATASMSPKENGKVGLLEMGHTTFTNLVSTALGVVLVMSIKPGSETGSEGYPVRQVTSQMTAVDLAADMIRNLMPGNMVRATLQKEITSYVEVPASDAAAVTNSTANESSLAKPSFERNVQFIDSTNVLGIIFCSVIFGLATGKAKEKGEPFLNFFRSTLEIILIVIDWLLWTAPLGIMSLIASSIADIDDLSAMFVKLGLFVLTVVSGLAMHQLLLLPLLHLVTVRSNPFRVHAVSFKAWCMAFASSSSAGAMPYLYIAAGKLKVAEEVSSLCIPMGVTFNANGSALFIACAILFLAQLNAISLGLSQVLTAFALVSVSSMALPSVPSASLVLIVILCTLFSIPAHSVGLLFAVEWFLDRIRTTGNVLSEMFALAFTWHFVKGEFATDKLDGGGELQDIVISNSQKENRLLKGVNSDDSI